MPLFKRASSKGSTVPINTGLATLIKSNAVVPSASGGGYTWGSGPRSFVGSSRGPDTRTELGRPGDFVEGSHVWGPDPEDMGFPYATRWPGYPGRESGWEPPFFTGGGTARGASGSWGYGQQGGMLEGRVSTVFACVDLISRTLSTMELHLTKSSVIVPAVPWLSNPEPELYSSMVDAMQALVNSMLLRGETFVAPTARYADGTVARWVVLNPDYVEVTAGVNGLALFSIGGEPVDRDDIMHIRYQTWAGQPRGVGPLEACWRNLVSADAMQRWGTELAVMNGIPTAILQSQTKLTKEQANGLKRSWAEATLSRGVLPAILSGGLEYKPLNLKPSDVGLLDLRAFDEQRIASTFGVPLWLVGLPMNEGLTYSTVQGTFDYFWRATLRPLAYNIASALSGYMLPREFFVRFASEQLTEPPITDRATVYKVLIEAGVIDAEEARSLEHLPPRNPTTESAGMPAYRNESI